MKQIIAIIAAVAALTITATAQTGVVDFGITNALAGSATEATNVGNPVKVDKQNEGDVGLVARMQGSSAGTGNITVTLARSPDGTVWETVPRFTWVFAQNGTTEVVAYTNLASGLLGAAHSIKVISVAVADDTAVTNAYIKVVKKQSR